MILLNFFTGITAGFEQHDLGTVGLVKLESGSGMLSN
jgi:hypothetical protein